MIMLGTLIMRCLWVAAVCGSVWSAHYSVRQLHQLAAITDDALTAFANTTLVEARLIQIIRCTDTNVHGWFALGKSAPLYTKTGHVHGHVTLDNVNADAKFPRTQCALNTDLVRSCCKEAIDERRTFCVQLEMPPLRITQVHDAPIACPELRNRQWQAIQLQTSDQRAFYGAVLSVSSLASFLLIMAYCTTVAESMATTIRDGDEPKSHESAGGSSQQPTAAPSRRQRGKRKAP